MFVIGEMPLAVAFGVIGVVVALLGAVVSSVVAVKRSAPPISLSESDRPLTIVVLGYPSFRSGKPHPVQKWRVDLAHRTVDELHKSGTATTLVFSGGTTRGPQSEARSMSVLFQQDLTHSPSETRIILEEESTSTWENVVLSRSHIEENSTVVIVSDPLHAQRAKRYWHAQEPSADHRVFITGQTAWNEGWWLKIPAAGVEMIRAVKLRMDPLLVRIRRLGDGR